MTGSADTPLGALLPALSLGIAYPKQFMYTKLITYRISIAPDVGPTQGRRQPVDTIITIIVWMDDTYQVIVGSGG